MMSELAENPAADRPTSDEAGQSRVDERPGSAPPSGDDPGPELEDDGSVPDKQIHRWKGEGGAVHPAD